MFNDIYQINLETETLTGIKQTKVFVVKIGVVATEVAVIVPKLKGGGKSYLLADLSDETRELILELNEIHRATNKK